MVLQKAEGEPTSPLVAQLPGERLCLKERLLRLLAVAARRERHAQAESDVNRLLASIAGRWQMPEGVEGALEVFARLGIDRARHRLLTSLLTKGGRRIPRIRPQRVVCELLDVLGQPVRVQRLDHLYDARVQRPPALTE